MAKKDNAQGPSFEHGMLAYRRSIQVSEGLLSGIVAGGDRKIPVPVVLKGVRGQSSEDKAKNPGKSNPQTVDSATVPTNCDRVELSFSLRVMPASKEPHNCGNPDVRRSYVELADAYRNAGGYGRLAELYAWNIANGRFAWRNRYQSDSMTVSVAFDTGRLVFDPLKIDLDAPADRKTMAEALVEGDAGILDDFIHAFANALSGEDDALVVEIAWTAEMLPGQEVFPSQEYVREDMRRDDHSRVYAKLDAFHDGRSVPQASVHSQKISAALRHIDIWHGDASHGAISVNPYAGVQETGDVLRGKNKARDFYAIRKNASELLSSIVNVSEVDDIPGDVHFFVANLVRGGVFGSAKAGDA